VGAVLEHVPEVVVLLPGQLHLGVKKTDFDGADLP
jgi:hypothetical protein